MVRHLGTHLTVSVGTPGACVALKQIKRASAKDPDEFLGFFKDDEGQYYICRYRLTADGLKSSLPQDRSHIKVKSPNCRFTIINSGHTLGHGWYQDVYLCDGGIYNADENAFRATACRIVKKLDSQDWQAGFMMVSLVRDAVGVAMLEPGIGMNDFQRRAYSTKLGIFHPVSNWDDALAWGKELGSQIRKAESWINAKTDFDKAAEAELEKMAIAALAQK